MTRPAVGALVGLGAVLALTVAVLVVRTDAQPGWLIVGMLIVAPFAALLGAAGGWASERMSRRG